MTVSSATQRLGLLHAHITEKSNSETIPGFPHLLSGRDSPHDKDFHTRYFSEAAKIAPVRPFKCGFYHATMWHKRLDEIQRHIGNSSTESELHTDEDDSPWDLLLKFYLHNIDYSKIVCIDIDADIVQKHLLLKTIAVSSELGVSSSEILNSHITKDTEVVVFKYINRTSGVRTDVADFTKKAKIVNPNVKVIVDATDSLDVLAADDWAVDALIATRRNDSILFIAKNQASESSRTPMAREGAIATYTELTNSIYAKLEHLAKPIPPAEARANGICSFHLNDEVDSLVGERLADISKPAYISIVTDVNHCTIDFIDSQNVESLELQHSLDRIAEMVVDILTSTDHEYS